MDPFFNIFVTKPILYGLRCFFGVILCLHIRFWFFVKIFLVFFWFRASPKGVNVAKPPKSRSKSRCRSFRFFLILNPAGCCRRPCLPFPCREHPYSCCLGLREHPCSCFLVLSTRVVSPADRAFGAQRFSGGRTGRSDGRRCAPPSDGAALRAAFGSEQRRAAIGLLTRNLEELHNCNCHIHLIRFAIFRYS